MSYKVLVADECFGSFADAERILRGYGMRAFFCKKDGAEVIKRVAALKPDAVVMNMTMRGVDGLGVLSRLAGAPDSPRFVLVYTDDGSAPVSRAMELGADYCLPLPIERHLLASRLDLLRMRGILAAAPRRRRSVEEEIAELLHTLAIPANIKGYAYLREAISLSLRGEKPVSFVTKELYPAVARRFGTTPQRVERAIRHAIESAWDRGDAETLCGLFGYTVRADRGKPTNGELIAFAADRLRLSGVCG